MNIQELILKNRSYRRFHQEQRIDAATLRELVDLARLSPSGSNLQPLKYVLVTEDQQCATVFDHVAWAGYLSDWPGPAPGQRPSAYIVLLCDTTIATSPGCDHGIAAQTIMLAAADKGIHGCMIGSIQRKELHAALGLDARYDVALILALGYPAEIVQIEPAGADGSIKYYRDDNDVHRVPKRALDDIIVL